MSENKTGRYLKYAIGEIILVVIGILIALQINNWNEKNQTKARVHSYMEQLLLDLEDDLGELDKTENIAKRNKEYAEFLLHALQTPTIVKEKPHQFIQAIRRSGYAYLPNVNRQTYDELISNGFLSNISSLAIKRQIGDYYNGFSQDRQWDVLLREIQANHWVSSAGILDAKMEVFAFSSKGGEDISSSEAIDVFETFKKEQELIDLLPQMIATQERILGDVIQLKEHRKSLTTTIKEHYQ